MIRHRAVGLAALLVVTMFAGTVAADTWTYLGGWGLNLTYQDGDLQPVDATMFGRSFTVPATFDPDPLRTTLQLHAWTWLDRASDGLTPAGAGVLYLLDQEYYGFPYDLSAATPGYMTTSSTYDPVQGFYFFTDNNVLNLGQTYWVYMADGTLANTQMGFGVLPGVSSWENTGILGGNYAKSDAYGLNYNAILVTPEPGTLALFGLMLGGAAYARRRKSKKEEAA